MNLSCYVIDDERHAIKVLSKYIEQTPGLVLSGSDTSPVVAWNKMDNKSIQPDITFLDVDMPQLSGMELAELIRPHTRIIFTTAFPDYAIQAFDTDALDYLLKPITYERFLRSVSKAKAMLSQSAGSGLKSEDHFYIKSEIKGKMVKVKYTDIEYIEAKANYIQIHLGKTSHLTYLTMKELEEKLPSEIFIRVHRSFIVNLQKVTAMEGHSIMLENRAVVDVGASYRSSLLSLISQKLISSKRIP